MKKYKCLKQNIFDFKGYQIQPLEKKHSEKIRIWRNNQLDILRQSEPLSKKKQDEYFKNVVEKLFETEQPNQLLFSFSYKKKLIGYGGLVHIDWNNLNAEISFLTPKERTINLKKFNVDWAMFLRLIKEVAYNLKLKKIFTYSYSIRTKLFPILIQSGFIQEAILNKHVLINFKWCDVFIHSYFLSELLYRKPQLTDSDLLFNWRNSDYVRNNSFNKMPISKQEHRTWYRKTLNQHNGLYYLFETNEGVIIAQGRIDVKENENIISLMVDEKYTGKGYATIVIERLTDNFKILKNQNVSAYVISKNKASVRAFEKNGYVKKSIQKLNGVETYLYTK